MAKRSKKFDNETIFEQYFLDRLATNGDYKVRIGSQITADKELCLFFNDLEEFLNATQKTAFKKIKAQIGAYGWQSKFAEQIRHKLKTKRMFEILKEGISINNIHLDLIYFYPERADNKRAEALADKNRFTAVQQWYFGEKNSRKDKSIDIVLLINGFAVVTIELKNEATSGSVDVAVTQYLGRPLTLPIFQNPFLHLAVGTEAAKMATLFGEPPTEKDFRHFNKDLINEVEQDNPALKKDDYPVYYLYYDILLPKSLLNFIEKYLYTTGKKSKWIFPRYHQQRAVKKVVGAIEKQYAEQGELNQRFLIQHSTGSGKSNTIVWLAQNLRNAFVGKDKLFNSVIILTDRVNLDKQISDDFRDAVDVDGVAVYARKTSELKRALEQNKKLIVSTIHKFSHLKELTDQTNKRICIIIDEGHRSQGGTLHSAVTDTFDSDENGIDQTPLDEQEVLMEEISKKRFPNMAFVALTATPSPETLKQFGEQTKFKEKDGKDRYDPHDVYSMDQAIKEGYIMDVAKYIYAYDTLYKFNKQVDTKKEFSQLQVRKALLKKAYENDSIIREKCEKIFEIFQSKTAQKIKGNSKAMIIASSRLAAVKYKLFLDEKLASKGSKHQTVIAFSGKITHEEKEYTEDKMNRPINPKNVSIEQLVSDNKQVRYLIVANKFQTGYSEPLLHTMFIDKPLRGRNAVQTLSRLNRIHPDKVDTLAIDFTGSYLQIMKAFKYYQKTVVTEKETDPAILYKLKEALLEFGVFTLSNVNVIKELEAEGSDYRTMPKIMGYLQPIIKRFREELEREDRDKFRTLLGRYCAAFNYIKTFYNIPKGELWDIQLFLTFLQNRLTNSDLGTLRKEIEEVRVTNFAVPELKEPDDDDEEDADDDGNTGGGRGGSPDVTRVRVNKTVQEVIEEVNLRFAKLIGAEGGEAVGDYIGAMVTDADLLDMIRNNQSLDAAVLYEKVVREEMEQRLRDYLTDGMMSERYSYDIYDKVTAKDVMPHVTRTAYNMMVESVRGTA